jgi:hypothetical protein
MLYCPRLSTLSFSSRLPGRRAQVVQILGTVQHLQLSLGLRLEGTESPW